MPQQKNKSRNSEPTRQTLRVPTPNGITVSISSSQNISCRYFCIFSSFSLVVFTSSEGFFLFIIRKYLSPLQLNPTKVLDIFFSHPKEIKLLRYFHPHTCTFLSSDICLTTLDKKETIRYYLFSNICLVLKITRILGTLIFDQKDVY